MMEDRDGNNDKSGDHNKDLLYPAPIALRESKTWLGGSVDQFNQTPNSLESNSDINVQHKEDSEKNQQHNLLEWTCWVLLVGWLCSSVAHMVSVYKLGTEGFNSSTWVLVWSLSRPFEAEISIMLAAFFACFCRSPLPVLVIAILSSAASFTTLLLYKLTPSWGYFDLLSFASFVIYGVIAMFSIRIHRFMMQSKNRGPSFLFSIDLFKYFFILLVPELIKIISNINTNGPSDPDGSISYTFSLGVDIACLILFVRIKMGEHYPRVNSVLGLLGLMKPHELRPFLVCLLLFLVFIVEYIVGLAGVVLDNLAGIQNYLIVIFGVIMFIQILQLTYRWRWLSWIA